jgi:tetratricopeptide (TPR) repeat protein
MPSPNADPFVDWYAQVRTPPESWRSLDEVRPVLAEFELRCDGDDYDRAAAVLEEIDFDYLQTWGHYSTSLQLQSRLEGHLTNPEQQTIHLSKSGACQYSLGNYPKAIELHTQALAIDREIGNRYAETEVLDLMALTQTRAEELQGAGDLFEKATELGEAPGFSQIAVESRAGIALVKLRLGNPTAALSLINQARESRYPRPFSRLWLLEGMAYLALKQPDQARLAFREAEGETGALLTLASEHVDALSARVLACCGLVVTGEPLWVGGALETLLQLGTVIHNAAGILTDVRGQFIVLAAQDTAEALAHVRTALFEEAWP